MKQVVCSNIVLLLLFHLVCKSQACRVTGLRSCADVHFKKFCGNSRFGVEVRVTEICSPRCEVMLPNGVVVYCAIENLMVRLPLIELQMNLKPVLRRMC